MGEKTKGPLGSWTSPISSELIVSKVLRLGAPCVLASGDIFWLEGRPAEQGRNAIVRRLADSGSIEDVTPPPASGLNVRTRVHEYGGGEYLVADGRTFFSNFADQRVYVQELNVCAEPKPLTTVDTKQRFADYILDTSRNRLIAVCEDHSQEGQEATNSIAAIDLATGAVTQLATGHDFFSSPRLSPDGNSLAWVAWDHPNMPWDDVTLYVGQLDEAGIVKSAKQVAGGADVSVQQPQWGPDGLLYYVGDQTNWWNIYKLDNNGDSVAVMPMAAEFGGPPWVFGLHGYQVLAGGNAALAVFSDPAKAGNQLGLIDTSTSSMTVLDTGFSNFGKLAVAQPGLQEGDSSLIIVTTAGSASQAPAVVCLKVPDLKALATSKPSDWQAIKASSDLSIDPSYISEPQSIEFPTEDGLTAFMNYYPPNNKDFDFPEGELPALLVRIHGGPTSAASTLFNINYQFWTSRGKWT
eukprot:gene8996-9169_t